MPKNSDFNDSGTDREEFPVDNSWLNLEIYVRADREELLEGLETLLGLGLIEHKQVKKLARRRLSCALPIPEKVLPVVSEVKETAPISAPIATSALRTIVRSFLDELSIRWLLFLGIFLVVVSSGVLAASQWQDFPDFGQYLVLLVYTLGFWGIGWWTGKQKGLRLTSQTLMAIANLLIPINFWAINYLGLQDNYREWGIVAVAALLLTGISYAAIKNRSRSTKTPLVLTLLFGLLSSAHLGWQIPNFPLVAIYGGIIAICIVERHFLSSRRKYPIVDLLYVFAAWSLLLGRNLFGSNDRLTDYSLAIAIFAWLIGSIYLARTRKVKLIALKRKSAAITNAFLGKVGKAFGIMLFIAAWSMSILAGIFDSSLFFAQTVGISLLAIHLFCQRLMLYWYKRDLTAIFLIGLQALYICKELIPPSWRGQALDLAVDVSNTEYFPESVLGVTLFPYVVVFVLVASWLYRRNKRSLATHTEFLTLCLGVVLTCLSFSNPSWRSLNLLCSTLTLGYVVKIRQPIRSNLLYFTHLLGLATVLNAIALSTNFERVAWGVILLVISAAELSIYIWFSNRRLQPLGKLVKQSCWYFGLGSSAISYSCFLAVQNDSWGLLWLAVPGMLTFAAKSIRNISQRRLATVFSCLGLIAAQLLVIERVEIRIVALAIATGLMYFNVFNLRRTFTTIIHLGLAIALTLSVADLFVGNTVASYGYWLLIIGAIVTLLYQLRLSWLKTLDAPKFGYISQRTAFGILGVGREAKNYKLVGKYIQAADYWATALIAIDFFVFFTLYLFLPVLEVNGQFIFNLAAIVLIFGAILWRYNSQPNNLVLYSLTGLWGILAAGFIRLLFNSNLVFATCNILLGIGALAIVVLLSQSATAWARLNLTFVPLTYAVLGILWRLGEFNAYTGLLTLGAAFIFLNTQPQNQQLDRTIKYFGFAGISWGIYELVIYQMQSQSGGSSADALTVLALVAAAIAFCYRLVAWRFKARSLLIIGKSKLILIAHVHWAISSLLKIIAAGIALESSLPRLTLVSIATSFCLGAYAVIQGRDSNTNEKQNDWWVYVGLVEIAATLVYSRLILSKLSILDPWRIVFTCAVALLIYQIPWQNFGWRSTPWQRTALIIPVLMALVTAEDISYFSLLVTAAFYLRIAYAQANIRWSYVSLGLLNWLGIRLMAQYHLESIWFAAIISLSILYIAQFDSYLQSHPTQRHNLRLLGSNLVCLTALVSQPGILAGAIAFAFIFAGLGLRIRAFLFVGTITLVITVLHQLIILVFTYSFLKWIVGLLAGISSIAIAAGFEQKRDRVLVKLKSYGERLQNWQ